jgi:hypothetical protein
MAPDKKTIATIFAHLADGDREGFFSNVDSNVSMFLETLKQFVLIPGIQIGQLCLNPSLEVLIIRLLISSPKPGKGWDP